MHIVFPRILMATAVSLSLFAVSPLQAAQKATEVAVPDGSARKEAIFAGGCFWCIEKDFEKYVDGVVEVTSGYIGGTNENPTYRNHTQYGHREAVRIVYDASKTDYETLLNIFFRSVDPTDGGGQFCDRGHSYTTAVYALDDAQKAAAEAAKAEAEKALGQPLATAIEPVGPFTEAEDYHQNYYSKNPVRYAGYRYACGRNAKVKDVWGDAAYSGMKDQ